jgi:hypothetical protein
MIKNQFDEIKKTDDSIVYFSKFEKAIEMSPIISFTKSSIEFPGMVVFSIEDKGAISKLLNPGLETFKVSSIDFENMINALKEKTENVFFIDKYIAPKGSVRLNMKLIKERTFYIKEFENSLLLNDILLTTSDAEFHGAGMFTGRTNVLLLNEVLFSDIKAYIEA